MKSLGDAAFEAIKSIQAIPKNSISLIPRENPLGTMDFAKIESLIPQNFDVRENNKPIFVPKYDREGNICGEEYDERLLEINFSPNEQCDPNLTVALKTPSSFQHSIYHLARLSAHMRNTKGVDAFQVILEDIAYDLRDVSEWAILKTCEYFRKTGIPFFPSAKEFCDKVKIYDRAAQKIGERQ